MRKSLLQIKIFKAGFRYAVQKASNVAHIDR